MVLRHIGNWLKTCFQRRANIFIIKIHFKQEEQGFSKSVDIPDTILKYISMQLETHILDSLREIEQLKNKHDEINNQ